jgi:mannose-6-phosphate isomerase-like protein (cupin superfamily)
LAFSKAQVVDAGSAQPRRPGGGTISERLTLGPPTGFAALEQTVLECDPGRSPTRATGAAEEVLFVLEGHGWLHLEGETHELAPESGAYLAPGEEYELDSDPQVPLRVIAVRIPPPDPEEATTPPGRRSVVRRVEDQRAQDATAEREFRVIADPDSGLRRATHFVGYIPAARAPDHFHTYDEVIYVLDGHGAFHAADASTPVGPGSCIQLPARTVHCLENTGQETLRVVAVFRPAGSPSAAYYPDGTPAYARAPSPAGARSNAT